MGFAFNVYIKLISYSDFYVCYRRFSKISENVIFENCIKNLSFEKKQQQILHVFKVARPVCSRLHFDLRKHFTQKPFIFKNVVVVFLHFLPKNEEVKEFFFQNTIKRLSI